MQGSAAAAKKAQDDDEKAPLIGTKEDSDSPASRTTAAPSSPSVAATTVVSPANSTSSTNSASSIASSGSAADDAKGGGASADSPPAGAAPPATPVASSGSAEIKAEEILAFESEHELRQAFIVRKALYSIIREAQDQAILALARTELTALLKRIWKTYQNGSKGVSKSRIGAEKFMRLLRELDPSFSSSGNSVNGALRHAGIIGWNGIKLGNCANILYVMLADLKSNGNNTAVQQAASFAEQAVKLAPIIDHAAPLIHYFAYAAIRVLPFLPLVGAVISVLNFCWEAYKTSQELKACSAAVAEVRRDLLNTQVKIQAFRSEHSVVMKQLAELEKAQQELQNAKRNGDQENIPRLQQEEARLQADLEPHKKEVEQLKALENREKFFTQKLAKTEESAAATRRYRFKATAAAASSAVGSMLAVVGALGTQKGIALGVGAAALTAGTAGIFAIVALAITLVVLVGWIIYRSHNRSNSKAEEESVKVIMKRSAESASPPAAADSKGEQQPVAARTAQPVPTVAPKPKPATSCGLFSCWASLFGSSTKALPPAPLKRDDPLPSVFAAASPAPV